MATTAEKQLKDEVQNASQTAKDKAIESGEKMKSKISERVFGISQVVRDASQNFRSRNENTIAKQLDRLAEYGDSFGMTLRDHGTTEFYHKAEDYGRRNPWLVFGIATVAGMILGRLSKAGIHRSGANETEVKWRTG